jgi:shikimate 5-dehydrogenase
MSSNEGSVMSAGATTAITATKRFSFVGVTTGKSAIMRVFPVWAEHLGLGDVAMSGHDMPIHAEPERYHALVASLKADPLDLGGLVTTHKLDLYAACRDLFDYVDPYAELLDEVSSLSKRNGQLRAHAKDPISSGRSLDEFVPEGYWTETNANALLYGAGGSNLAITLHLMSARPPEDRPRKIVVVNRSGGRIESMRKVHEKIASGVDVVYVVNEDVAVNDRLLAEQPPGSLVVNGTGMGKDTPGSPISDAGVFPERVLAWELNYRGELDFLHQARRQEETRGVVVEDGWRYFIYGWTCVMEEVFDIEMTPEVIDELSEIGLRMRGA